MWWFYSCKPVCGWEAKAISTLQPLLCQEFGPRQKQSPDSASWLMAQRSTKPSDALTWAPEWTPHVKNKNWICPAHALQTSLASDAVGHPTQQKAKLVPADSSWCSNQLEKNQICLFLIHVWNKQAGKYNFRKIRKKELTLKGKRDREISYLWGHLFQLL